jgi:hypothetical protein
MCVVIDYVCYDDNDCDVHDYYDGVYDGDGNGDGDGDEYDDDFR